MKLSIAAPLAAALAFAALTGCTSSRLGSLDTSGASQPPEALPAAPSGTVQQSQLPPPSTPQPGTPSQFPEQPAAPGTTPGEEQQAALTPPGEPSAPAGGADVTPGAVAGVWNASVGGQSCRIATPQTSFGPGYRAAPLSCPAPISGLKAWSAKGKQLVLYDENGTQIASLYSSGGSKFDGQTTDGKPISLTR